VPLRTNIIGKNICIDSRTILTNFLDKSLKTIDKIDNKIDNE